jgi:hypothetical protein
MPNLDLDVALGLDETDPFLVGKFMSALDTIGYGEAFYAAEELLGWGLDCGLVDQRIDKTITRLAQLIESGELDELRFAVHRLVGWRRGVVAILRDAQPVILSKRC